MGKMLQEFKEFALKGNVVDMAIGVVIGGAFGGIVTSVVDDLFTPIIAAIVGDVDFSNLKATLRGDVTINYGNFIQVVLNFLIIALCLFAVVKAMNKLKKPAAPAKAPRKCPYCKSEIADDATRCPHCTSELKK
ncbi:MAG: large conductance mechanosensitive channel protein MscL [Clostridia bacterium]|nr:large conductance mechanosensitive channel protein MscL [Clostridia bacterium]MBQ8973255.1 large conductance mechanosensitive channel protein MscL [Clostridia bacterium]